jgi:hypothetical protein
MYVCHERPIAENEIRMLQEEIRKIEHARKTSPISFLGCFACTLPLSLIVFAIKPHDPINRWGALIMLVTFAVLIAAVQVSIAREGKNTVRRMRAAMREGSVEEHRVTSERCIKIEDDEGEIPTLYFFDAGALGTVLVSEDDLDPKEMPNTDFTLTYILDSAGFVWHMHIRLDGKPLEPLDLLLRADIRRDFDYDRATLLPRHFDDLREELLRL